MAQRPFPAIEELSPRPIGLDRPFDLAEGLESLGSPLSTPLGDPTEQLRTMTETLRRRVSEEAGALNSKYSGPMGWLKDRLSVFGPGAHTRAEFTNGLSVQGEMDAAKGRVVAEELERNIHDVLKSGEDNLQEYLKSVRDIMQSRPGSPEIAQLRRPNKEQLGFALLLAALSPGASGAILEGLLRGQVSERDRQQQINDTEFEQELAQIDAQLGIAEAEFTGKQGLLEQELLAGEQSAQRAIKQQGIDANRLEYVRRLTSDMARIIKETGDKNPAAVEAFLRNSADVTGLSDTEITDIVNASIDLADRVRRKDEADIALTLTTKAFRDQQFLTEVEMTETAKRNNEFAAATYNGAIQMFADRVESAGLSKDILKLQKQELEIKLPFVPDQIRANLARTKASTDAMKALAAKAAKDTVWADDARFELEVTFAEQDLAKERTNVEEYKDAVQNAEDGLAAGKEALRLGLLDEDGNPLATPQKITFLTTRLTQTRQALKRAKDLLVEKEDAVRFAHAILKGRVADQKVGPVRPNVEKAGPPTGKIGGGG